MKNNDKSLSLLSICQKAGKVKSGEYMTEASVKGQAAFLVIVATDASANTKKEFRDMCSFYEVEYREYSTKENLGQAIGKEERASLAICDEGLSKSLLKNLDESISGKEQA